MASWDDKPAVSVITPTKNRRALLRETIESVRAQDFSCWEHIIVDDGSDDGTMEELSVLQQQDPRVRFLLREGQKPGPNVCRNQGVQASRGDLVIFLDSDDLLAPDALGRRVNAMARNSDCDFVLFRTSAFIEKPYDLGKVVGTHAFGDDLTRFLYFELPWIITGPTWRKATLFRLGLLDEALPSWQDVELHVRAIARGCKYLRFDEIDNHMRWQYESSKVSVEQRKSPHHLVAAEETLQKFERLVSEGPGMSWVRQRAICSLYFFVAESWVERGNVFEGLRAWRGIRRRNIGTGILYAVGSLFLGLQAPSFPARSLARRACHKWKGWARLRTEPELIDQSNQP